MCLGLPILSYGIDYNLETTNHRARYFNNAEDLLKQLSYFVQTDLSMIGVEMQKYAMQKYAWQRIASLYLAAFEGESQAVAELSFTILNQSVHTIDLKTNTTRSAAA